MGKGTTLIERVFDRTDAPIKSFRKDESNAAKNLQSLKSTADKMPASSAGEMSNRDSTVGICEESLRQTSGRQPALVIALIHLSVKIELDLEFFNANQTQINLITNNHYGEV